MAILRNGLRSSNPRTHDEPIASHETPPAADDSDDSGDEDAEDEEGIPSKATRPLSSRSNNGLVSLGRPPAKQPEHAGRTTRSGRISLPLQTHETAEQPSKRRRTVHGQDAYAIPSSPPPRQDPSEAHRQDNVDDKDDIMPGLLGKVRKVMGTGGSNSKLTDSLGETIPATTAPEQEAKRESVAVADGQQAERAGQQMEDEEESLFVSQQMQQNGSHGIEDELEDNHESIKSASEDVKNANYKESTTTSSEGEDSVARDQQHVSGVPENAAVDSIHDSSNMMDGVEDDELEDFENREPPSTHRFKQDLADFDERHQEDETFVISFTAPPADNAEDVHVKYEQFRLAVLRMKEETWTGYLGANWVNQPIHTYFNPVTTPGKALFSLVRRFESLSAACPEVPRLRRQIRFLRLHERIISHYLSQLVSILHHICYVRLVVPKASNEGEPAVAIEKREAMLNEAFRVHIPLLLHCAHVIWKLAGREDKNCFTQGTLDILEFFLQAARQECESIIRLLRPSSEEKRGSSQPNPLRTERLKQAKDVLQLMIYAINNVKAAREALAEEGEKRAIRQQKQAKLREQLERDRLATQEQLERDRLATQEQLAEIKSRRASMLFTQPTSTASSQMQRPPASAPLPPLRKRPQEQPSDATKGPTQREQPRRSVQVAQRSREPVISQPRQPLKVHYRAWNLEEQQFLLREIKKAYIAVPDKPQLPDIDGYLRKELNRPIDDILHQTEALLAFMLMKTGVVRDGVEVEGWVRRLMATYDGVGRISSKAQNRRREEDVFGQE